MVITRCYTQQKVKNKLIDRTDIYVPMQITQRHPSPQKKLLIRVQNDCYIIEVVPFMNIETMRGQLQVSQTLNVGRPKRPLSLQFL